MCASLGNSKVWDMGMLLMLLSKEGSKGAQVEHEGSSIGSRCGQLVQA